MLYQLAVGLVSGTIGITLANWSEVTLTRQQATLAKTAPFDHTISSYRATSNMVTAGLRANVLRNAIVNAAELTCYTQTKAFLLAREFADGPLLHAVSAVSAAALAAAVGTPVDTVKVRLQAKENATALGTIRHLWRREGVPGFYRGVAPHFALLATFNVLFFVSFESVRRISDKVLL